jgi:hypothetical protein
MYAHSSGGQICNFKEKPFSYRITYIEATLCPLGLGYWQCKGCGAAHPFAEYLLLVSRCHWPHRHPKSFSSDIERASVYFLHSQQQVVQCFHERIGHGIL